MISASALKLHCGYPRALGRERKPNARQQAAMDLGTAFHAAVAEWAEGKTPNTTDEIRGWLDLLAIAWAPPPRGAHFEVALGLNPAGKYVGVWEKEPHVYLPIIETEQLLTAGRADVVWLERGTVVVRDWKSGRYAVDHPSTNLQLLSLGFAAASMHNAEAMRLEIYYVRDGVTEAHTIDLDSDEAAEAWDSVVAAATLDEAPRPGPHCAGCWESRLKRCKYSSANNAA